MKYHLYDKNNKNNDIYYYLDKLVNGVDSGELVVIAARPGCGKTTIAQNIKDALNLRGYKTLFFSQEMTKQELKDRQARYLTINNNNLINKLDIIIDEPKRSLKDIENGIKKYKPSFVFIDYLNIMSAVDSIKIRTTELKAMAKKYNVVIFCLAQVNRKGAEKKPDLTMLKDSGTIEQDATQVGFLTQDRLIVAKNRKGAKGELPILCDFERSIIYIDSEKIVNWKKCLKLYEKGNISHSWGLGHKIKRIDEEFYGTYCVDGNDASAVEFVMVF